MLAYSSVAQLGYVFMGIGLGTEAGIAAACFQMLAHACTKSLLFVSVGRLASTTGHDKDLSALRGSAWNSFTKRRLRKRNAGQRDQLQPAHQKQQEGKKNEESSRRMFFSDITLSVEGGYTS